MGDRRRGPALAAAGCGGCGVAAAVALTVAMVGAWTTLSSIRFGPDAICDDSALERAALAGDAAAVEAEVGPGGAASATALECAVEADQPAVVTVLLAAGAAPTVRAAEIAAASGQADVLDALVGAGLDLTAPGSGGTVADEVLASAFGFGVVVDLGPTTPASERPASPQEVERVVAALVAAGADPSGGAEGPSPLLVAAWSGDDAAVRALLGVGAPVEHGGAVETMLLGASAAGLVPAAGGGAPVSVDPDLLVLDAGDAADGTVDQRVANVSPLVGAAWGGHVAIATALLDAGADPNAAAGGVFTPIYAAALRGDGAIAELLLSRGAAAVPAVEPGVPTPAEAAAAAGHPDVAALLGG